MTKVTQKHHQNILVIKLGALGDFIQCLGPMRAIRHHHPNAKITLLTTKPFQNLAEKSNYFDEIIIDSRPKFYHIKKWLDLKFTFNAENFARVYDLQNNDRTAFYLQLFSPKPQWVGTAKGASHRNTSPERTAGLAFYGHVQTLGLAGIKDIHIDEMDWINPSIKKFNLQKPYALIVPGCAPTRPEKRWPAEHFIALCKALTKKNMQPVIIGTDSEKTITDEISNACPDVINLAGKTSLFDVIALGRSAKFAIGNDTGPMHMIAPTGCKTLVLFSRHSDPKRHSPLGKHVQTIQEDNLKDLKSDTVLDALGHFN